MEAVDVLHAIERLVAIARSGPALDPGAHGEVSAILARMGVSRDSSGYKAEKLSAVSQGFDAWLGSGQLPGQLLADIEKLRKALARGSEGQD
jgi:hypothetical protein